MTSYLNTGRFPEIQENGYALRVNKETGSAL